ncbi:hypothetical protein T492DRAFT_369365 [Pavlovales sp. CCMP2436]|nr:hypothetical protein T492DRAFT_369365 [Pavlovales sp. CCMP2436]
MPTIAKRALSHGRGPLHLSARVAVYRDVSPVSWLIVDGIRPLSWLCWRSVQVRGQGRGHTESGGGEARRARHRHAHPPPDAIGKSVQVPEPRELADRRRDRAIETVQEEGAACGGAMAGAHRVRRWKLCVPATATRALRQTRYESPYRCVSAVSWPIVDGIGPVNPRRVRKLQVKG